MIQYMLIKVSYINPTTTPWFKVTMDFTAIIR